ncbi:MAG: aspartate ammonia-lyase [Candidatus Aminicenantes bacterium]|nr:aspartate ammonia-lyase [Candidatus Aminicenantes bacterium]
MARNRENRAVRREKDFLGMVRVPAGAYFGIQTVRASRNFPISGLRAHPEMVRATALIKKAAALVNARLGRLDRRRSAAIVRACDEIIAGKLADQFIVDIFQMGAGTSFHMNVNEVIANRAEEKLGGKRGEYRLVHPNDHVNLGQSTNDVYPTAMRLAAAILLRDHLLPKLGTLEAAFLEKAREFAPFVKSGRTHLQDAAPVRLGSEFLAYSRALGRCRESMERSARPLVELGIGGSAVGTGLNTAPGYGMRIVGLLGRLTGLELRPAEDLMEAMQSMRPFVEVSAALRGLAIEINRIANDLRLLASGPRTGLAEIAVPAVAPGSSIMPGKVNPSMLEMVNMVCYQVLGCDLALCGAAQAGQLELNVMMPVIAFNLHLMIEIMGNAVDQVGKKCVLGIQADGTRCREYSERSLGLATALSPLLGYARTAEVAREALRRGKTIRAVALEKGILTRAQAERLLDLEKLTQPPVRAPARGPRRKR